MIPGEILYAEGPVALNEGREVTRLAVVNAADRPVQVGSHYHFAEANPGLDFDRAAAHGLRLNIAAGTAVRFEPGIPVDVELVPFTGRRVIAGLRGETRGFLDVSDAREAAGPPGAPPTPKSVGETAKSASVHRGGGDGGASRASAPGENGVEGA